MIKKSLCLGFVLAAVCGFAEVFTWTGAVDGAWTNAANWSVGGVPATRCPGVLTEEIFDDDGAQRDGWMTQVALTDLAEFASVAQGAATTVDFHGLYCVSSIVFRASCAKFTLGVDEDDVIALQAFAPTGNWTSGGFFTLESGATVPTIVGAFSLGATCRPLMSSGTGRISFINNTSGELVFKNMGYSRLVDAAMEAAHVYMRFGGTGDFRFDGRVKGITTYGQQWKMLQNMWFYFQTSGKITFSSPQFGRGRTGKTFDDKSNCGLLGIDMCGTPYVEIKEGCRVSFSDWNYPTLSFSQSGEIGGKGTLQLCVQSSKGVGGNYGHTWAAANRVGTISCNLDIYDGVYPYLGPEDLIFKLGGYVNYTGVVFVAGSTNAHAGPIWFYDAAITYRANKVSNFGSGTSVFFRKSGIMDYAGAGNETFSKDCYIVADKTAATVRNTGTGALTIASAFAVTNASYTGASVVLDSRGAPIVFTGTVTPFEGCQIPLVKEGVSTLDLGAGVDLSGVSALRLCAGRLEISGLVEGDAAALPCPLTFDTGSAALVVPNGVTLTVPSLAATSGKTAGTLNILCDTGRVKVAGATAATALPAGVTINGTAATFDASGTLVLVPPTADVSIAAKGDVVPNGPAQAVAIMTEGTSGNDTLAEATTKVKTLYHYASADATVEIGEGLRFAADQITLLGLAGNLSLGVTDDAGLVGEGTIQLANNNPNRVLSVNAGVAAETEVRVANSAGKVVLAGGSEENVSIRLRDGALTLTGDRTFNLNGGAVGTNDTEALTATLVLDGAREVVLGETPFHVGYDGARVSGQKSVGQMVVTNSYVHNVDVSGKSFAYSSTNDALCVGVWGDATLRIQAGSVITNRFLIGGIYYHQITTAPISHGAVIQEGGEVAMLSGGSCGEGSTIGAQSGNGYYELRGGKLSVLGNLSVGHYGEGCGSFAQYGGTSVFTSVLGSTTKPTIGPNASANGGMGIMRFVGGRAEINANVTACGGYTNGGRSLITVEEGADVDAFDNSIKLCGAHSTHNNFKYFKQADFVLNGKLRAGGFYCGYNSSCVDYPQFYSVGFDGGTFVTGAAGKDIAQSSTSSARAMTNFVVYAKGATVDTDGKTGNRSSTSFRGAWGKGVASMPFANGPTYSGFVAAPYILIYGDGVGATAVADFDSASGTVTGVRVLTPGVGYTWAKAIFFKDSYYHYADGGWYPVDCVLRDNVNTGSFTKKGAGDFTLNAPNSWGGKTFLKEGVLRLGVAGALPEGSSVVYEGGTLESTAAASPATLVAEISASLIAARKPVTLIAYTDAAPAALPEVTLEGIPEGEEARWGIDFVDQQLRVKYIRSTVFLFR